VEIDDIFLANDIALDLSMSLLPWSLIETTSVVSLPQCFSGVSFLFITNSLASSWITSNLDCWKLDTPS
jgi:hypothetical protein